MVYDIIWISLLLSLLRKKLLTLILLLVSDPHMDATNVTLTLNKKDDREERGYHNKKQGSNIIFYFACGRLRRK